MPRAMSAKLLWLHFAFATFVIMFGYLCNLVSVDMVAVIPPRYIEDADDLLLPEFAHVRPTTITNLFCLQLDASARKDSKMKRLQRRVLSDVKRNLIDANTMNSQEDGLKMIRRLLRMLGGSDEVLVTSHLVAEYLTNVLCHLKSDAPVVHRSKQSMYTTNAAVFYSRRISPELRRFFNYRFRTSREMGTLVDQFRSNMFSNLNKQGLATTVAVRKCMGDAYNSHSDREAPVETLDGLRKTSILSGVMLSAAMIVLATEVVVSSITFALLTRWTSTAVRRVYDCANRVTTASSHACTSTWRRAVTKCAPRQRMLFIRVPRISHRSRTMNN